MLSLTRRVGERIIIGDDIVIKVSEISVRPGDQRVTLAFTAPKHIRIDREELRQKRREAARK